MSVAANAAIGVVLLVAAIFVGSRLGRRLDNEIALLANGSQALGGLFYIIVFGALVFFDGWVRIVGVVLVIIGAAIATKRGSDTRENLRRQLNG